MVSVKECFSDRAALMELKKVSIPCRNHGCNWQGLVNDYLVHIKLCKHAPVPCPNQKYGCSEKSARCDMPSHEMKCQFKPVRCSWCDSYVPVDEVNHEKMCSFAPQDCPAGCGEKSSRNKMEQHFKINCKYQVKECEFKDVGCKFTGDYKALEQHYTTTGKQHLQLVWKNLLVMEKTIDSKHMTLVQQISDLKSEINHVHREISVEMQPLIAAMSKAETAIQNLQEGFSELALLVQTLQATSYDGSFIWKIPEIQRRRHEAKIGKTISLYSAPFYTSRQGYKACLRLYMDGDGCGKNTHLSFFLTIMKGEYDAPSGPLGTQCL